MTSNSGGQANTSARRCSGCTDPCWNETGLKTVPGDLPTLPCVPGPLLGPPAADSGDGEAVRRASQKFKESPTWMVMPMCGATADDGLEMQAAFALTAVEVTAKNAPLIWASSSNAVPNQAFWRVSVLSFGPPGPFREFLPLCLVTLGASLPYSS